MLIFHHPGDIFNRFLSMYIPFQKKKKSFFILQFESCQWNCWSECVHSDASNLSTAPQVNTEPNVAVGKLPFICRCFRLDLLHLSAIRKVVFIIALARGLCSGKIHRAKTVWLSCWGDGHADSAWNLGHPAAPCYKLGGSASASAQLRAPVLRPFPLWLGNWP